MQKPLILSLTFAVVFTGCSAFKKSQTWQQVVDQRADQIAADTAKSGYPNRLHAVLAARNVEHKVVTYQYRYLTPLREEAVGSGQAVLYRDTTTPGAPWWATDDRASFPVWVPNGGVDQQVSFFLRHKAEVIAQHEFPAGGEGKAFDGAPAIAAPLAPTDSPARLAQARRVQPQRIARVAPRPATLAAATAKPVVLPGSLTSIEERFDKIFRTVHGTTFDPHSSLDRQKMAQMRATRSAEL